MGKLIEDEFSDLPVSRQRKDQLRMRRDNPERYYAIQKRQNYMRRDSKAAWAKAKKEREGK